MDEDRIARLRISLDDWEPEIWRTVEVPLSARLTGLHQIIQAAMGWQDCHLWEFETQDGARYGPVSDWGDEELAAAQGVTLGDLIGRGARAFSYTYDMGDDWGHLVTVESIARPEIGVVYPRLIDGARCGPPEDVGGPPGFAYFLEALADPAHEEHRELMRWYGGPFDEEAFDKEEANRSVAAAGPCG